ncbi:PIN domain nuclease [Mycobacterium avium subsp. hominissuis]|uniref:Type II toxin-antitoxin system VapC family toxin n=1 Tax=Mycobacterium paraffinicum TaxID=53378 RepID=A0ABP8RDJ0_9MYCO|nr:type II toxin-antitoxin system VapC family toxin [Mycobacterium avium]ETA92088.1 twitching motility protein PilT [Mycobacterium avium 10-5581]MCH2221788.1 type II toxin-antitoxin system VapC family toxin [Dechloromonas sp.]PBJ63474.1 PIN domain nuclease [Mycobacterium avium subsp. hominissuis]QWY63678.1 type II toxin-antitoxin system VapC family toxin [Mycobacterium avium subsp. hominissuis]QWY65072.1 type II toxin-antitoxin system VapC family toxin [Mycobacterium avium subsp. hominissuis]
MNVLLDTRTLLWLVSDPSQVAAPALAILSRSDTNLWVSAASAWETSIKTRLGRLDGEALLSAWTDILADMSTAELPIESSDAILAGRLPWEHKDPFDRVIVAQALRRNLTIATRDSKIIAAAMAPTLTA